MNVLMVGVSSKRYGGMWTVVQNYMDSKEFQSHVNLVYVATSTNGSKITRALYMLLGYIKILFFLISKKTDIVHVHMAEKGSVFRKGLVVKLGKFFGCKVIIHMHAGAFMAWYNAQNDKVKKIVLGILTGADRILVLGEYWKEQLKDIVTEDRIGVLYNSVQVPEKNNYNVESSNIVYMAVVKKEKGIYDLLQAMADIDEKLDSTIKLLIYGTDLEGGIQEKIKSMNLADRVIYKGWINEEGRDDVMKNAMLSVLPSYYEGLSMSIIEAMSYGVPVVTTNISTMGEVLGDKVVLINPGDVPALAAELMSFCESKEKRHTSSEYLYNRACEIFKVEEHVDKLLKIYDEILTD